MWLFVSIITLTTIWNPVLLFIDETTRLRFCCNSWGHFYRENCFWQKYLIINWGVKSIADFGFDRCTSLVLKISVSLICFNMFILKVLLVVLLDNLRGISLINYWIFLLKFMKNFIGRIDLTNLRKIVLNLTVRNFWSFFLLISVLVFYFLLVGGTCMILVKLLSGVESDDILVLFDETINKFMSSMAHKNCFLTYLFHRPYSLLYFYDFLNPHKFLKFIGVPVRLVIVW